MSEDKKILITGFDDFRQFGRGGKNISRLVLPEVQGNLGHSAVTVLLPTEFKHSVGALHEAVDTHQPEAILHLGESSGKKARVEHRARNITFAPTIPDMAGERRVGKSVPDLPFLRFLSVSEDEVEHMISAMEGAGVNTRVSYSAGMYVCNHLFANSLQNYQDVMPVHFIHLGKRMSINDAVTAATVAAKTIINGDHHE